MRISMCLGFKTRKMWQLLSVLLWLLADRVACVCGSCAQAHRIVSLVGAESRRLEPRCVSAAPA
jgi:hypothetical protein